MHDICESAQEALLPLNGGQLGQMVCARLQALPFDASRACVLVAGPGGIHLAGGKQRSKQAPRVCVRVSVELMCRNHCSAASPADLPPSPTARQQPLSANPSPPCTDDHEREVRPPQSLRSDGGSPALQA